MIAFDQDLMKCCIVLAKAKVKEKYSIVPLIQLRICVQVYIFIPHHPTKDKYTYGSISSRSCTVVHTRQNISCFDLACRADAQYSSLDLG